MLLGDGSSIALADLRGETRYKGEANRISAVCSWKTGNSVEAARLFERALYIADAWMRVQTLADQGDWAAVEAPDLTESAWREARNIFCKLGGNDEVLRLDRSLISHTLRTRETDGPATDGTGAGLFRAFGRAGHHNDARPLCFHLRMLSR